jgi:ABC-type Fe3+-siderophore transport system permease subunit
MRSAGLPPVAAPPRRSWLLAAAIVLLADAGIAALSVRVGPRRLSTGEVLTALAGSGAPAIDRTIVRDIRLPRAILGLIVGASLAAAGAIMQGMTRNPLASPTLLGLSAGGSLLLLVAVTAIPAIGYPGMVLASFLGAALGTACVHAVGAMSRGGLTPVRLALAGAAVSTLLGSIASILLVRTGLKQDFLLWTAGGLLDTGWDQVVAVLPVFAAGMAAALWLAGRITILSLGVEVATGLGLRAGRVRAAGTIAVLLLAGGAISVAGPIAFVGLLVPHACRYVAGFDYRAVIPLSAATGALVVAAADVLSRTVAAPRGEIPAGVFTAILGAPLFLLLARSSARGRSGEL